MPLPRIVQLVPPLELKVLKASDSFSSVVTAIHFVPHIQNNLQIKSYSHA
jgi:hypothetical protein